MDWDTLRVVLAIHKHGNLTKAAHSLEQSAATVGRHLSRLEESLGTKIFDRFNSGLYITEVGQEVLRVAEQVEREVTQLQDRVTTAEDPESGELRVSLPLFAMFEDLAEDIVQFMALYPKIKLTLLETDNLLHPHAREAEITFRAQSNPSSGLWGYKLDVLHPGFYASTRFLEKWGDLMAKSPQTVPLPYIELEAAKKSDGINALKETFPNARAIASVNSYDCLLPLMAQGLGIGRITSYVADYMRDFVKVLDSRPQIHGHSGS